MIERVSGKGNIVKNNAVWVWVNVWFLFFCADMLFSEEMPTPRLMSTSESSTKNLDDAVVLCLSYRFGLQRLPLKPGYSFVQIVIWDDGRVLVGKEKTRESSRGNMVIFDFDFFQPRSLPDEVEIITYEYFLGKTDSKTIQALLREIEINLQLKKHQTTMMDFGPSASTYSLYVNFLDGILEVETWEKYNPAESYSNTNVIQKKPEGERGVLLLPDFYKGWKVIKKDMFDLRDEVMKNSDSALVDVEWRGGEKLFIRDKSGKLIYEGICPIRFLEERRKQLSAKGE